MIVKTRDQESVVCKIQPVKGTEMKPASVAAVFPVPKTRPARRGAISRWLVLTPPRVSAEKPRPIVMRAEAMEGEAPTRGETASNKQAAGPTIPATWSNLLVFLILQPDEISRSGKMRQRISIKIV